MNFTTKSECDMDSNHGGRLLFIISFLLFCLFVSTPRAQAGESGMTGFVICETPDPGNQFYVAGDPVYISAIFHVAGESRNVAQAFDDFLKQKYGTKSFIRFMNCPISYTSDGATKTFNDFVKRAGEKLVRTGWTLAPASSSAAPGAAFFGGSFCCERW
jgi:hypothetical protein